MIIGLIFFLIFSCAGGIWLGRYQLYIELYDRMEKGEDIRDLIMRKALALPTEKEKPQEDYIVSKNITSIIEYKKRREPKK